LTFVPAWLNLACELLLGSQAGERWLVVGNNSDHKKYQPTMNTSAKPRSEARYFVFAIGDAPSSQQSGWQSLEETG
jgi:hypothetical protein